MSKARAMPGFRRREIYQKINGTLRLTRRQWRRMQHKSNHAMAPFGKRAGS